MVREGGAATETRAGVAEIRRRRDGELEQEDVARTIAAVAAAAQQADLVIAYQHNHYWETDNSVTPQWQRSLARKLIDAGAGVFVGHGAPLLQGLEVYSGRPLFYGLGSFIFQTKKAPEAYSAPAWQSLIAECRFAEGKFQGATLIPVQLNAAGVGGAADLATRGRPTLARGEEARRILNRLAFLSARLGHVLRHDGRTASVSS
jgi:poly-gamma-glutamate synthesis protein (capsule biosynthesis protein)